MIIAICGFMGTGKSSFLKQFPEIKSIDLDLYIEQDKGSIAQLIRTEGFEVFRQIESKALKNAITQLSSGGLISLGGGSLDLMENIDLLKSLDVKILYLKNDFETCYTRIQGDQNRPQLDKSKSDLEELFNKRAKIFESVCDVALVGDNKLWPTDWTLLKVLF
ncbi:shikimate kinase [Halobacteriovorax sp. HLS]|uniref:shikimate kinase n=1 Tax=Halobacteriovorax sp. HLS TaxID=2234000 RepID=UPI000FDC983C|nr:shikimate kinase [Halobacteriovorax sp. HLS]